MTVIYLHTAPTGALGNKLQQRGLTAFSTEPVGQTLQEQQQKATCLQINTLTSGEDLKEVVKLEHKLWSHFKYYQTYGLSYSLKQSANININFQLNIVMQ